jgi:hypothetical protein
VIEEEVREISSGQVKKILAVDDSSYSELEGLIGPFRINDRWRRETGEEMGTALARVRGDTAPEWWEGTWPP